MLNLIFNTKALPVILGAAILTGTTTCLVQQRQLLRLRSENQNLLAQEQPLRAEHETATKRAEATQEQLARLQRDNSELLRLRNEVGQLRRELETAKQKAPPPSSIGQSGANAGRYLSKEELAFAGYATPEAALQSMTWAMLNGNYEQTVASMSPEIQQHREPDDREQFEKRTKIFAPLVKGIQILARKRLAEGKVELKMRMDTDSAPGLRKMEAVIQPMVKLGDEWKLSGSSREYKESWDQDGQVEALVP